MLTRAAVGIALLVASANSARADGAWWTGKYVNDLSVPVSVSLVTTQCWYPVGFGYNTIIESGATIHIVSRIDASFPGCYENNNFFLTYTMTPQGFATVNAALKVSETGGSEYCILEVPGPTSPAQPCMPVAPGPSIPNPVDYIVRIRQSSQSVISYSALFTSIQD